jgi:hypothetical protein
MLRTSLITATSVILCATASAQQTVQAQRVPGPVKNAGIYHLATGTWTRSAGASANLGPDDIYRNDAPSGYFTTANVGFENTDEGEIPTTGSPWAADRDVYEVNCFTIGYCSDSNAATHTYIFYDSYAPCDNVQAPANCLSTAAGYVVTGLPGGPAGTSCWIATLDLTGVEFCLEGDGGSCNPGYDNNVTQDSFGWGQAITGSNGGSGPLLNGDPSWTTVCAGANWGGGGTYYETGETCVAGSTGLNTSDLFFATDTGGLAPGCYWFGGYLSTNGCGGPTNTPFASFTLVLSASTNPNCDQGGGGVTVVCDPANNHTQGNYTKLDNSTLTGGALHLEATDGPSTEFGYFLVSSGANQSLAVSNGILCLDGPQGRYAPAAGATLNSIGQFDGAGVYNSTVQAQQGWDVPSTLPTPPGGSIQAGDTWFFQMWYRDQQRSNFSNAISVQF